MFKAVAGYYKDNERLRLLVKIIVVWLISRAVMLLMVPVMNLIADEPHQWLYYMNPWDAEWYKGIVENGYQPPKSSGMASWAFFPLYPLVCMAVRLVTMGSIDTYAVGMTVSNICIIIAVYYAVKYADIELDMKKYKKNTVEEIIIFLMLGGPFAVYYGAMYTEALFILCVILCFYNSARHNYMAAGIAAAMASATRIVGCMLVFVLITYMFMEVCAECRAKHNSKVMDNKEAGIIDKYMLTDEAGIMLAGNISLASVIRTFIKNVIKEPKKLVAIMISPLGIFIYMNYLRYLCGDSWAFYHVQRAWRTQKMFPVIGVLFKSCTGQLSAASGVKTLNGIILGWLCVITLMLYAAMIRKKHYALGIFGIIVLLIPLTSSVMSTLRFIMGSFVIYIGVAEIIAGCNRYVRYGIIALLSIVEVVVISAWYFWDGLLM